MDDSFNGQDVASEILAQCAARGPAKSICPSEMARRLAGDDGAWRDIMPLVHAAAADLQEAGKIRVTRRGQAVSARESRGPVRLSLPG